MTKIKILSDLHTEHHPYSFSETLDSSEDYLFLGGDCFSKGNFRENLEEIFSLSKAKVIFTPGNHEYYHQDFNEMNSFLKELEHEYPDFHCLLNETLEFDDIRVFGGTMFSDFDLFGNPVKGALEAKFSINDFMCILNNRKLWTVENHLQENRIFKEELKGFLELINTNEKNIILSHFNPVKECVNPKFLGSPVNPYFCSDLDESFYKGVDLWISGHGHNNFDFIKDGTRFVGNQRGYSSSKRIENLDFEPNLTVIL